MEDPVRVLCVGAREGSLERMAGALERRSSLTIESVVGADGALERLGEEPAAYDCVVAEYDLANTEVLSFHAAVRDRGVDAPIVAFTGDRSLVVGDVDPLGFDGGPDVASPDESEPPIDPLDRLATRVQRAVAQFTREGGDTDALPLLRRHARFLDVIPHPMYVLDDEGTCVVANEAMLEFIGQERGNVEGRNAAAFIGEEEFEAAAETLAAAHREDAEDPFVEFTIEAADGTDRHIESDVSVLTDDDGAYTASIGVLRDVTERVERQRRLAQYQSFLETAPIGMFAIDPDGEIIWANEQMVRGMDRTTEDLVGLEFRELVEDGYFTLLEIDEYLDYVRHLLSSENDDDRIAYEVEWEKADGERAVSEVHMGLLPLEDGEFAGTVFAFRRITERKRYERELERQNERLEQFASFVSHDLRNPLNVGRGNLELLAAECDCDTDALEDVRWSLERMDELITDLLALAREGRAIGSRETVRLDGLAEAAWEGVETGTAALEVAGEATLQADSGRVRELFENLYRNAIEHAGEDVTVTVGTIPGDGCAAGPEGAGGPESTAGPEASGGPDGVPAGFYVEDDGPGIPSDQLGGPDDGRIFEVGYTTEAEGTGFGLGIVREIAEAHGWTVRACEAEDGGARFEIRGLSGRADGEEGERVES